MQLNKNSAYTSQLESTDYNINAVSLEEKIRCLLANNSPIDSISPMLYTDRKDGVLPQTDIRTDRWEIAVETADKVNASLAAARQTSIEKGINVNEVTTE